MHRWHSVLLLALGAAVAHAQPSARPGEPVVRYDGHKIASVTLRDLRDLRTLEALGIDPFVCELRRDGPNDFRVPPDALADLVASGIPHTIIVEDLQRVADAERERINRSLPRNDSWFAEYKDLAAVETYMAELAALRPDLVTEITLGNSLQGRPIRGLRIANDGVDIGRCKPAILLNSVQHAREWITVMNNMYVADHLVRQYETDAYARHLVDHAVFYIVPVVNPDGYVYTWTTDRYWRKNRRSHGFGIFGVDLNRNWGYKWGLSGLGSSAGSGSPWSDVYWGASPFSEPETQRLRDFVLARPEIKAHNDIHSHGQLILWSWGWTDAPIPDQAEWQDIGDEMAARILDVDGRVFEAGSINSVIYPVSGGSVDWFYYEFGVLSMSYELRGPGFNPPATDILPGSAETLGATLFQAESMIEMYQFRADWNRDCVNDLLDLLDFLDDFAVCDPRADLNLDGVCDVLDLLDFLQYFEQGR